MSLKGKPYVKDTFCIAPWTEIHFGVSKEVMPCCTYTRYNPFGNLNDTDDIEEIYNSENAKTLRKKLFNGEKVKECNSCWKQEKLSKATSYRQFHNDFYGKYLDEALENTNEDFSLKTISPKRLDIRFDNKCNLKCRICNSTFSTSWYADEVKLGLKKEKKVDVYKEAIPVSILQFITDSLPHIDEIFFAGGEPLIQDGHYKILEASIKNGSCSNIRLTYNTNFSTLKYKDKDLIDLWKHFQFVNIGASLDASHEQGEYQRKNISWKQVVENRKKIIDELPTHDFEIIPTVSILNVYNILEFHKEWVTKKLLNVNSIKINLLVEPHSYDLKNLPEHHKEKIRTNYTSHIKWLESLDSNTKPAINEFKKVINYIKEEGDIEKLKEFIDYNYKLDEIRDEKFFNIYPEFSDLEWFLKYQSLKDDVGERAVETIGSQKHIIEKQKEFNEKAIVEIDRLNKKIAEKDSFISNTLHDKTYIKELELLRDELNDKIAKKDEFITNAIFKTRGLTGDASTDIPSDDEEKMEEFFTHVKSIKNYLDEKIKKINKENGYKSLL